MNSNSADNLKAKKKPNTREASGSNRSQKHNPGKAQDLAKLADTLRAEGLWSDLMKEVVYLATQGKNVSLKERQLVQEELAARQDLSELLLRHLS